MRPFDLFLNSKHGQMDGPTNISSYRDAIQHLCDVPGPEILGLPDIIQEEKPSFFNFENNWLRTDGRTDGRTDTPSNRDESPEYNLTLQNQ